MTTSVIGMAKKSVDHTIDAYFGRAAFAVSILAASVFALAGAWLALVERFGAMPACFGMALILIAISGVVRLTITSRERAAEEDLADVEKSLETSGGPLAKLAGFAMPFDMSTALTFAPLIIPMLRSARLLLPIAFVVGLIAALMASSTSEAKADAAPT
ncbi:MAG: hypothetical protein ACKVP4_10275 [Hyphomicrobium sp.]